MEVPVTRQAIPDARAGTTANSLQPTAYGSQLAAPDQADSDPPLRRGRGDAEDVGANRGEDVGPETAILPLLQ